MENTFDVPLIVKAFIFNALVDQQDLLRRLANPFRDSTAVRMLVVELADNAQKNKQAPSQVIGMGLVYGMALGIFVERDRASRKEHAFDVHGVAQCFTHNIYPGRTKLIEEFTPIIMESAIGKRLLVVVATEVLAAKIGPAQVIAMALRYGMVVGISLEKDRIVRERLKPAEKAPVQ